MSASERTTVIRGGRLIDPANGVDQTRDLHIRGGRVVAPDAALAEADTDFIEAAGLVVAPGLIDLHVHLREPGQSGKETIESGARAAAGGRVYVCGVHAEYGAGGRQLGHDRLDRGTRPPESLRQRFPGRRDHQGIGGGGTGAGRLDGAGGDRSRSPTTAIACKITRRCAGRSSMRACSISRVFDHCQDYSLVGDGVMHEGYWSTVMGLPGWPAAGEELIVLRNILLADLCASPIHLQHLSCAGSVRHLREARARGVPVSGEVCPHHLALTDESLRGFDSNFKMNPPLRMQADIDALVGGVADGRLQSLPAITRRTARWKRRSSSTGLRSGSWGSRRSLGCSTDFGGEQASHRAAAVDRAIDGQSGAVAQAGPRDIVRRRGGGCDVDRCGAGMDGRAAYVRLALAQHAIRGVGNSRGAPCGTIVGGATVWAL